ncbi:MAG: sulfurtransferase-like selenium metabolism protein YedF [Desulfuromonadia bacterium]
MSMTIDCRTLPCPEPVLTVRGVLERGDPVTLTVLVDNEAAHQNVRRFLDYRGYRVSVSVEGETIRLDALRPEGGAVPPAGPEPPVICPTPSAAGVFVLVTSRTMGHGDDGLGEMLMFNFLKSLKEMGDSLTHLTFVNDGVRFVVEGSDAIPILRELADKGVTIAACGACLGYFHLLERIAIGEITNMAEIVERMGAASKIVTI